jgi:hypothetical protein
VNPIIGAFVAAWTGYFALLVLLPIRYRAVEPTSALRVLAIYVVVAVACAVAARAASSFQQRPTLRVAIPLSCKELNQVVITGLLASFIGAALIAYVRVVVEGIDLSHGLVVARELWSEEGSERGGIASPLSIPGYDLCFFLPRGEFSRSPALGTA